MNRSLHLHGGRNYHATHPISAQQLLNLVRGYNIKVNLREQLEQLKCRLFGHDLVLDRWVRADNAMWFRDLDYEIHLGCRRCPFMLVLPPEFDDLHGKSRLRNPAHFFES
jgi:hypothetical protein